MKRLHFTFSAVLGDGLLVNDASILEKHVKTENWSYLQNRKSYKRLKKKNVALICHVTMKKVVGQSKFHPCIQLLDHKL